MSCRRVHPSQVQRLVCVNQEVAESDCRDRSVGHVAVNDVGSFEPSERIGVTGGTEPQGQAGRHREIDDDLRRLPATQHDRGI